MGFLVVSRKKNEIVHFDGPGSVRIVEIRGDTIRLGFEADESTNFRRAEVNPIDKETLKVRKQERED